MKKILITLIVVHIIAENITAQPTKPHTGVSTAASTSVKGLEKDNTVQGLKNRNMSAAEILVKIKPTYQSQGNSPDQTLVDLYNAGFSTNEIVAALKNKYSLSLEQCTKAIFLAYFRSVKCIYDYATWPYSFQEIISDAYSSQDKFTIRLLKQAGMNCSDIDPFFQRIVLTYFTLVDKEEKFSNYLKQYVDAGFIPSEIYLPISNNRSYPETKYQTFCLAMKKAGAKPFDVIYPLKRISHFQNTDISTKMKTAGFSAGEILDALSRF